jgi:hypothetical protein
MEEGAMAMTIDKTSAKMTVDFSKAKPKFDVVDKDTAINHLTEGTPQKATLSAQPLTEFKHALTIKGEFDLIDDAGTGIKDWKFGLIQVAVVFVMEDLWGGQTPNDGSVKKNFKTQFPQPVCVDSSNTIKPFTGTNPFAFDVKSQGKKDIYHITCELVKNSGVKDIGDHPHSRSELQERNDKSKSPNFLFITRRDLGFTTVLVAIEPNGTTHQLVHANWKIVWSHEFRWKAGGDTPSLIIRSPDTQFNDNGIKQGPPTDANIANLVSKPVGPFFNDQARAAILLLQGAGTPGRTDDQPRASSIPADFFT